MMTSPYISYHSPRNRQPIPSDTDAQKTDLPTKKEETHIALGKSPNPRVSQNNFFPQSSPSEGGKNVSSRGDSPRLEPSQITSENTIFDCTDSELNWALNNIETQKDVSQSGFFDQFNPSKLGDLELEDEYNHPSEEEFQEEEFQNASSRGDSPRLSPPHTMNIPFNSGTNKLSKEFEDLENLDLSWDSIMECLATGLIPDKKPREARSPLSPHSGKIELLVRQRGSQNLKKWPPKGRPTPISPEGRQLPPKDRQTPTSPTTQMTSSKNHLRLKKHQKSPSNPEIIRKTSAHLRSMFNKGRRIVSEADLPRPPHLHSPRTEGSPNIDLSKVARALFQKKNGTPEDKGSPSPTKLTQGMAKKKPLSPLSPFSRRKTKKNQNTNTVLFMENIKKLQSLLPKGVTVNPETGAITGTAPLTHFSKRETTVGPNILTHHISGTQLFQAGIQSVLESLFTQPTSTGKNGKKNYVFHEGFLQCLENGASFIHENTGFSNNPDRATNWTTFEAPSFPEGTLAQDRRDRLVNALTTQLPWITYGDTGLFDFSSVFIPGLADEIFANASAPPQDDNTPIGTLFQLVPSDIHPSDHNTPVTTPSTFTSHIMLNTRDQTPSMIITETFSRSVTRHLKNGEYQKIEGLKGPLTLHYAVNYQIGRKNKNLNIEKITANVTFSGHATL